MVRLIITFTLAADVSVARHNKPPTTPMTFSVLVTLICVLLLYYIDANKTNPVIKNDSLFSHPYRDVRQAVSIRLKRRTKLSDSMDLAVWHHHHHQQHPKLHERKGNRLCTVVHEMSYIVPFFVLISLSLSPFRYWRLTEHRRFPCRGRDFPPASPKPCTAIIHKPETPPVPATQPSASPT